MKIKDVADALEIYAPLPLQEGYDNAGMQIGLTETVVTGALLCLDVTEEVIDEAIALGYNLIVAHHPLLFHSLKKITGSTYVERCAMKAIAHGIAIYAAHTNLDNVEQGVSHKMAEVIGLTDLQFMEPMANAPKPAGSGVIGVLPQPEDEASFVQRLKHLFHVDCVSHGEFAQRTIRKVALCGGAGSFLIPQAMAMGADAFVTGEIAYHEYFDAHQRMLLCALGHYESEQFTTQILHNVLGKACPGMPLRTSQVNTNPIRHS